MNAKKLFGILVLSVSIFFTSCGVGPVVKELKKINDNDSRYWSEFIKKNGINAIDQDRDTVLIYAVQKNNTDLIKACIKSGADVNLIPQNVPPIFYCVANKNIEMVNLFLKNNAYIFYEKFNLIQLSIELYSAINTFDDSSKKINDLIFSKMSLKQINDTKFFAGVDTMYLNDQQRIACRDILLHLIEKGFTPKADDVRMAILVLLPNEDNKVIYDFLYENYTVLDSRSAFNTFANWEKIKVTNNNFYKIFIKLLQSNDISADDYDINASILKFYRFPEIDDYFEKVKEVTILLKEKNYDFKSLTKQTFFQFEDVLTHISYADYHIQKENEKIEYYRNNKTKDGIFIFESSKEFVEGYEKDIINWVEEIKSNPFYEIYKYLKSEGYQYNPDDYEYSNEEQIRLYEIYEKYVKE